MFTSGMINCRAFSGRGRPQGPGDEDESRVESGAECVANFIVADAFQTIRVR